MAYRYTPFSGRKGQALAVTSQPLSECWQGSILFLREVDRSALDDIRPLTEERSYDGVFAGNQVKPVPELPYKS
jgi:hypothetical protein